MYVCMYSKSMYVYTYTHARSQNKHSLSASSCMRLSVCLSFIRLVCLSVLWQRIKFLEIYAFVCLSVYHQTCLSVCPSVLWQRIKFSTRLHTAKKKQTLLVCPSNVLMSREESESESESEPEPASTCLSHPSHVQSLSLCVCPLKIRSSVCVTLQRSLISSVPAALT